MFDKLIALLLPNVELVSFGMIILVAAVSARILSGTLKNIYALNYKWDWGWFLNGVVKGFVFTLAVGFASVVAAWFPSFLELAEITNPEMSKIVSVIAITVVIAAAVAKYFAEAVKNFMVYLGLSQEEVDGYAEIQEEFIPSETPSEIVEVTEVVEVAEPKSQDPSAM
jgi:uncharacterized membrane protein